MTFIHLNNNWLVYLYAYFLCKMLLSRILFLLWSKQILRIENFSSELPLDMLRETLPSTLLFLGLFPFHSKCLLIIFFLFFLAFIISLWVCRWNSQNLEAIGCHLHGYNWVLWFRILIYPWLLPVTGKTKQSACFKFIYLYVEFLYLSWGYPFLFLFFSADLCWLFSWSESGYNL